MEERRPSWRSGGHQQHRYPDRWWTIPTEEYLHQDRDGIGFVCYRTMADPSPSDYFAVAEERL